MRVLLIEDDPEHADLIRTQISRRHNSEVKIQWVDRLAKGLQFLSSEEVDVILLDLGLPDSTVDKTLGQVLFKASGIPVVVLSSLDDEDFGIKAVHEGAQDYISKSWMDGELLFRSLRYAIERKTVEEELRKTNRMKDEFLATLSHELRTPVSVIQGFAEILNEGNPTDEQFKKALAAISRNAKLQVSLINDMLDMSSIITGKLVLHKSNQNLARVLEDVMDSIKLAAQGKNISLTTFVDSNPNAVSADPVRLHQILWNLFSNSIKFTPSGGRIDVRLKNTDEFVEIQVADSGEGIDSAFLPFVFDRFRQQDNSIRRQHGGLGLGLAIVKYLVDLHGGKISVKSDGAGKGTVFTLLLPTAPFDEQNGAVDKINLSLAQAMDGEEKIVARNKHVLKNSLSGVQILAIDDSSDTLDVLSLLLKRYGASVFTAESAAQATKLLATLRPHVIVCDIGMPDEDGYTFIKRLRAEEASKGLLKTPATALTAFTHEEDKKEALRSGFQAHLSKPIDEQLLVKTVSSLAGRSIAIADLQNLNLYEQI